MNWNVVILIAQVVVGIASILVGYYAVPHHRAVYYIEHDTVELGSPEPITLSNEDAKMQEFNKKLASGSYTILSVTTDHEQHKTEVYFGRIRK